MLATTRVKRRAESEISWGPVGKTTTLIQKRSARKMAVELCHRRVRIIYVSFCCFKRI